MQQPKIDVAISILNWNAVEVTKRCVMALASLSEIEQCSISVLIVVVDNASDNGSGKELAGYISTLNDPRFHFIQSDNNGGFSAGNNLAIQYAISTSLPEFIWVLNNDTIPHEGSLRALVRCGRNSTNKPIIGSTLLDAQTGVIETAGGCRYYPWVSGYRNLFKGKPNEKLNTLPEVTLDYVCGASMFVRTDFLRQKGLLDERYFLYFEELELAKRLDSTQSLGWCRESLVSHSGGESMRSEKGEITSVYYSTLSALIYTRRWHPRLLPLVVGVRLSVKSIFFLMRGKQRLISILFKAISDFYRFVDNS